MIAPFRADENARERNGKQGSPTKQQQSDKEGEEEGKKAATTVQHWQLQQQRYICKMTISRTRALLGGAIRHDVEPHMKKWWKGYRPNDGMVRF